MQHAFSLLITRNSTSDARFLLRFLRTKKFSTVLAQEALERYLLLRQAYAPAFRNLDYTDHTMNELISNGYISTLLKMSSQQADMMLTQRYNIYIHIVQPGVQL
jgi:hypothetical protein